MAGDSLNVRNPGRIYPVPGHTYNGPIQGGYTPEHSYFNPDNSFWFQAASAPLPKRATGKNKAQVVQGVVAVKVHMGTVKDGKKTIHVIGVSTY